MAEMDVIGYRYAYSVSACLSLSLTGGKRKYKENAFTAKAESGTLKVKILRKDMRNGTGGMTIGSGDGVGGSDFLAATSKQQKQQQQAKQQLEQQQQQRSPPKPRPNRKHVPIFYQQKNPTTTMMDASSSSTDESMAGGASQSMSTTSVDYNDQSVSVSSTMSQDSSGGRFSSLLSGLHLDSNTGGGGNELSRLPPPPASNPLFSRNDSDGSNTLGDLLRHSFPSAQGPAPPPPQLGNFSLASSIYHHHNQAESASGLHKLAYGSSLASLSSAARDISNSESNSNNNSSSHNQQQGYRFNPFTALQSAIDVHQAAIGSSSSSSSHAPYQYPHERHQHQSNSAYAARQQDSSMGDDSSMNDLGPPPSAPPAFAIQNSLMGGGIESQPVIANVNTHNFDWSNGTGRPRSGSLPNILEAGQSSSSSENSSGGDGSSGNVVPSASNRHMWKEV